MTGQRVLILGADGFIGRHIAFHLKAEGYAVTACARRTDRLARMGFDTVEADLTDPACHNPSFWRPKLANGVHLVNVAGLLSGSEAGFAAVHETAPRAAYAALNGGSAVLISAVGVDADTPFAVWRRKGEAVACKAGNVTILRPGLVMADTSYGGTSLLRAIAVMPIRMPVVGSGNSPCNPISAEDLAAVVQECLEIPPGHGPCDGAWDIGGPETLSIRDLLQLIRRWFGLRDVPVLSIPDGIAGPVGWFGDALRLGPISETALRQLQHGIEADPAPLLERIKARPESVSRFLFRRPAGTQDLWQARLYLLKPLIRLTLALLWLASGLLGLFLPSQSFPTLVSDLGLADTTVTLLARSAGLLDLALAAALLRNWRPRLTGFIQASVVAAYTLGLSVVAPGLWLAPFGELLKNLPVLVLIAVHLALAEER